MRGAMLVILGGMACTGGAAVVPEPPAATPPDRAFALVEARFLMKDAGVETLPARISFFAPDGRPIGHLDDAESNVFHKAIWWRDGLLTVAGEKARVLHWTPSETGWSPRVLWQAEFGGTFDRMRDIEIGDVDGDGADELVVATHDQGVVAVLDEAADKSWSVTELSRIPNTFVHEIELGDLDGDGTPEIYATPSEPNRSSGVSQPGRVMRFAHTADGYDSRVIHTFEKTHAKEILVADLGAGPQLFAVAEGVTGPGGGLSEPVRILRLDPTPSEAWTPVEVAALLGERQSRFLLAGDLDGSGTSSLIATGMTTGVWRLDPLEGGAMQAKQIDGSTGGFEHAAHLADLDGNGRPELYVASEPVGKPREVRRYAWTDGRLRREILHTLEGQGLVWGLSDLPWGSGRPAAPQPPSAQP